VIVSKRELLEHLYDYNWEHHSNVIEAHVSNLRKKLDGAVAGDGAEAPPVIETMRGRGYRMAPEGPGDVNELVSDESKAAADRLR
jgi:two-component system response regulator PhoP